MAARYACLIFILLLVSYDSEAAISVVYDTQTPQQIEPSTLVGSQIGALTGVISITYESGGVEWKGIKTKFKSLDMWFIDFEMPNYFWDNTLHQFYYDRLNEKVKSYAIATGSESAITKGVTLRFNAMGQR